jgi:hypothetical protein
MRNDDQGWKHLDDLWQSIISLPSPCIHFPWILPQNVLDHVGHILDTGWEQSFRNLATFLLEDPHLDEISRYLIMLGYEGIHYVVPGIVDAKFKRHIFTPDAVRELRRRANRVESDRKDYFEVLENYQLRESEFHGRRQEIIKDLIKRNRWTEKRAVNQWKIWFSDPQRAPAKIRAEIQEISRASKTVESARNRYFKSSKRACEYDEHIGRKVQEFTASTKLGRLGVNVIKCRALLQFYRALDRDYAHPKKPVLTEPYCYFRDFGYLVDQDTLMIECMYKMAPTADGMRCIGQVIDARETDWGRFHSIVDVALDILKYHARNVDARLEEGFAQQQQYMASKAPRDAQRVSWHSDDFVGGKLRFLMDGHGRFHEMPSMKRSMY